MMRASKIFYFLLAVACMMTASATYTAVETHTGGTSADTPLHYSASYNKVGSDWFATATYDLTKIDVNFKKIGSPTGNIWIEIYASDASGYPTGSVLATSANVDVSTIEGDADGSYASFTFASPATITNTNHYVIVADGDFAISASNNVRTVDAAATGRVISKFSTSWSTDTGNFQINYITYKTESEASHYTVDVSDLFNNATLGGVTLSMPSGKTNTTLANGTAVIYGLSGWQPFNATLADYYTVSGWVAENATATANMTQAIYTNITIYRLVDNLTLDMPINISLQGGKNYELTGSATEMYLRAGAMNITFSKPEYYTATFQKNVTVGVNTTTEYTGAYQSRLNVTARNAYSNATILNMLVNVSNFTYSYNDQRNITTGSDIWLLMSHYYNVTVDAEGYVPSSVYVYVLPGEIVYNFTLWSQNSVYVNIYDEDTSALITENITVLVENANFSMTNYTTSGAYFINNLVDGSYQFKFSGANYSLKSYTVTVADRSTQTLNAFLTKNTTASTTTIMTIKNINSGTTIEGASISMYRQINGTWEVVESKSSDVTGKAQFTYTAGVNYKFIVTASGFTEKTFYLNPILYSTYTVKISPTTALVNASELIGVSITYSPREFLEDEVNNFTWTVSSPAGVLTGYWLNISYPGGSGAYSGTNAIGGVFVHAYNLSNATGRDYFNLSYSYNSTLSGLIHYSAQYRIRGTYGNYSIEDMKTSHFGLGMFETILIAVLVAGVIGGLAATYAGAMAGGVAVFVLMGFFAYIGFVPWWASVLSLFFGFLLILRGGE